jgi:hypothetical protein
MDAQVNIDYELSHLIKAVKLADWIFSNPDISGYIQEQAKFLKRMEMEDGMNFITEMEHKMKKIIDLCFDIKKHKLEHKPKDDYEKGQDDGAEKIAIEILRCLQE